MSRRRFVPLALAVTLLLAVVAIVAGGRPLGAGNPGGGGLPLSFWDYTYTTVVIALAVLLLCLGVVAALLRVEGRPRKSFHKQLLYYMVGLTLIVILGTVVSQHHLFSRLHVHLPQEAGGQGPEKRAPGRVVARSRPPGFKWLELFVVIGLFVLTGGIGAAIRTRRRPATRLGSAPEALAAALDESLDDLRADPDLRRAIVAAYARMEQALAAAGIPRHPAEAPFEYLERALLSLDASAGAVRRLTDLFEWARFSHHEPEPSMRDDAVDALLAVRDELRAAEPIPA